MTWLSFFYDLADPRTRDRFLMGSPLLFIVVMVFYVRFVKIKLSRWMKTRKAFDVRLATIIYFSFNNFAHLYLALKGAPYWLSKYSWRCEPLDTSSSQEALDVSILQSRQFETDFSIDGSFYADCWLDLHFPSAQNVVHTRNVPGWARKEAFPDLQLFHLSSRHYPDVDLVWCKLPSRRSLDTSRLRQLFIKNLCRLVLSFLLAAISPAEKEKLQCSDQKRPLCDCGKNVNDWRWRITKYFPIFDTTQGSWISRRNTSPLAAYFLEPLPDTDRMYLDASSTRAGFVCLQFQFYVQFYFKLKQERLRNLI
jgi:hypothetical protein